MTNHILAVQKSFSIEKTGLGLSSLTFTATHSLAQEQFSPGDLVYHQQPSHEVWSLASAFHKFQSYHVSNIKH